MTQTPVSTLQPALSLTEFLDTTGVFPPEGGGSGSGPFLGSIGIFAGPSFLFAAPADGQSDPISNNTALFSILGTDFGGDGTTSFELPNLGGIETIGAGQGAGLPSVDLGQTLGQTSYDLTNAQLPPSLGGASAAIDEQQPSLGLNYVINAFGVFPSGNLTLNSLGVVSAFAGNFAPGGELFCDGQLLPISEYSALFNLIGTTYGGNGVTTFALPDLQGRDIVGAGDGFTLGEQVGTPNVNLTNANSPLGPDAPVANQKPGLVMNYYIALSGIFPSGDQTGNASQQTPHLGPDRCLRREYLRSRGLGGVRRPIASYRPEHGPILCAGHHLRRRRRHYVRPAEFAEAHRAGYGRRQRTGHAGTGQRRERDFADERQSARSNRPDDCTRGRYRGPCRAWRHHRRSSECQRPRDWRRLELLYGRRLDLHDGLGGKLHAHRRR